VKNIFSLRGCSCVSCPECNGTGTVWFSFNGDYLGYSRCDDMDDMQTCMECEGSGIADVCDCCQDRFQPEADEMCV
jgi:hypothetical protein